MVTPPPPTAHEPREAARSLDRMPVDVVVEVGEDGHPRGETVGDPGRPGRRYRTRRSARTSTTQRMSRGASARKSFERGRSGAQRGGSCTRTRPRVGPRRRARRADRRRSNEGFCTSPSPRLPGASTSPRPFRNEKAGTTSSNLRKSSGGDVFHAMGPGSRGGRRGPGMAGDSAPSSNAEDRMRDGPNASHPPATGSPSVGWGFTGWAAGLPAPPRSARPAGQGTERQR